MALPPVHITVKRRRDEEPPDALYFPSAKKRPSAVWTLQREHAQSIPRSSTVEQVLASRPHKVANANALQPHTSSTSPVTSDGHKTSDQGGVLFQDRNRISKEHDAERHKSTLSGRGRPLDLHRINETPSNQHARPRTFHLIRSASQASLHRSVSPGGITKTRRPRKGNIACFAEEKEQPLKFPAQSHPRRANVERYLEETQPHTADRPAPRKRPSASAAEKAWRARTWGQTKQEVAREQTTTTPDKKQAAQETEGDLLDLAKELQQFAIRESEAVDKQQPYPHSAPTLKFQPKPPKPRQPKTNTAEQALTFVANESGGIDDYYVTDTYVRVAVDDATHAEVLAKYSDPACDLGADSVGILVIDKEDEATWEAFADDDDESSLDGLSDDEDENAEDFYGNDYPDEELDSEDEIGHGAYGFRTTASDDEEFGDEDDVNYSNI